MKPVNRKLLVAGFLVSVGGSVSSLVAGSSLPVSVFAVGAVCLNAFLLHTFGFER
jgi:hypothetical protein